MDSEKKTILVIEDHEAFRDILVKVLTLYKYHVVAVDLGSQGLEAAEREHPDAIILDIMMPELDGYETCRRLREVPGLADVPIIVLTALSAKEVRAKALAAGADACLSKPCPIDLLEGVIKEKLELPSDD